MRTNRKLNLATIINISALSLVLMHNGHAQVESDTVQARQYYNQGDSLYENANYDASSTYFEKALNIYKAASMWKNVAQCYNKISANYQKSFNIEASVNAAQLALEISTKKLESPNSEEALANLGLAGGYYLSSDYPTALTYAMKAVRIQDIVFEKPNEVIANTFNSLGVIYIGLAKYDSALYYLEESISLKTDLLGERHSSVAYSYKNLSALYYFLGNNEKALYHVLRAIDIGNIAYKDKPSILAGFYSNAAAIYTINADLDMAQTYNLQALRLLKDEETPTTSEIYNTLGIISFQRQQYDQALAYFEKGLNIQKQIIKNDHPRMAVYHSNMGRACGQLKKYDLALDHLSIAEGIFKRTLPEDHPEALVHHLVLGGVYHKKMDYERALLVYKKGSRILESRGNKNPFLSEFYNNIGSVFYDQNQYDSASIYFHKALSANLPFFDSEGKLTYEVLMDHLDQNTLLLAIGGKAKSLLQQYQKNKDPKYLLAAKHTYQLCDSLVVQMRQTFKSHEDKVAISEAAANIYDGAIQTSLELANKFDNEQMLSQAFYFSEKSKAGTLQEVLNNLYAKNFAGLSDDLTTFERELKTDRSFYHSKILEQKMSPTGYDTALVDYYEDHLFRLNRSHDSLSIELEQNYPAYYQMKYQTKVASVKQIQKKLSSNEALIEYFWADSSLYVFVITDDEYEVVILDKDSTLQADISGLRKAWDRIDQINSSSTHDSYTKNAFEIYKKILKQPLSVLEPSVNRLIIIPDGPLSYIPFDVLLTEAANGDYRDLPYLLRSYQIRYSSGAQTLFYPSPRSKKPARPSFLAFAPVYQEFEIDSANSISLRQFRDRITALDWNQPEAINIGNYLDGVPYLGSEAVESQFKKAASQYSILHLAMHAFVDEENPLNSKFIFTQSQDSAEDGFLHTFEIYDMELNADLAVLSACNTGYGKLVKGEGMMSLARAFSYAGVPSIVMSHWPVNDEASAKLIGFFYENLAEGMTKDEALRQAKLKYLENADNISANPFFWGSFVLTGDPAPIKNKKSPWLWSIFGMAALALAFGFFKYRQPKN